MLRVLLVALSVAFYIGSTPLEVVRVVGKFWLLVLVGVGRSPLGVVSARQKELVRGAVSQRLWLLPPFSFWLAVWYAPFRAVYRPRAVLALRAPASQW